ncbi:MAG: efflux RND transporter periplasmic adaptor subunit [bacterium]
MPVSKAIIRMSIIALLAGCSARDDAATDDHGHAHPEAENWAVTAWGERYEIFPECEPLIAGKTAKCHTHVTILSDFSPQREGSAAVVLRAVNGTEQVFRQDTPLRDGIYSIEITPSAEGLYFLLFRIASSAGEEEIRAGRVRVGDEHHPGGAVVEPGSDTESAETVSFLKEQQWRTEFATEWTRAGAIRSSLRAPGRIRPTAGGDAILSAPLDGAIAADTRLYAGLDVKSGARVASLAPRASANRTLAEIESESALARNRLERLEKLLALEAVSISEVDEARARVAILDSEIAAVRGGAPARGASGTRTSSRVDILAPFAGRIAEVFVVPGQSVTAGEAIARLVKVEPLWVEVSLPPAAVLSDDVHGLVLTPDGARDAITIPAEGVRLISRSPAVDAETGTIAAIFEIPGGDATPAIGTALQVDILFGAEREGIVIPSAAIVDDAGIPVVYVQVEGESIARREVHIVTRQGNRALVEGLKEGERLVTRGGAAVRRASLVSSGAGEGHVH